MGNKIVENILLKFSCLIALMLRPRTGTGCSESGSLFQVQFVSDFILLNKTKIANQTENLTEC